MIRFFMVSSQALRKEYKDDLGLLDTQPIRLCQMSKFVRVSHVI